MQQRLFQAFVAFVDNTPGLEVAYQYVDAILDIMEANTGNFKFVLILLSLIMRQDFTF